MAPACIVCAAPADVYCHNDDANLCFACDHTVHSAHALALTHRRTPLRDPTAVPNDSLDEDIAVPQELMPLNKTQGIDDIDLSFSDDAWFAVPDTACSTARGGMPTVKSSKDKGFELDDLFGFDAALDEEVAFGLDAELSGFEDCLVPEIEPVIATQPPCTKEAPVKEECEAPLPAPVVPAAAEAAAAAPAAPHAPTAAAHAAPITFSYASESVPTVDNYIPHSLLPIDSSSRNIALAERREKVQRFREKKKNRQFKKLIRYASRKRYAEVRPRIKGRFARKDEIAAAKAAGVPLEC